MGRKKKERKIGIYCIENKLNHMKYIGKSKDINNRMMDSHWDCRYLNFGIRKYGINNFDRYIIEYCEFSKLSEREVYYIREWNTKAPNGYNLTDGGDGGGKNPSNETVQLLSKIRKGKATSEETKKKQSIALLGKPKSLESRKKLSEGKSNRNCYNFGKKTSAQSVYFSVYRTNRKNKKWQSGFSENGVRYSLGRFKTEIEAALAYDKYVKEHALIHPLNFPNL